MKPHRIDRRLIAVAIAALTLVSSLLLAPLAMAAKVDISSPQAYLKSVAPMAQASMKQYGVPASVAIAQSIQETGWGRSSLSTKGHAYFGIKCGKSKYTSGCIDAETWEVYDGKSTTINAAFRSYPKPENSFLDHGLFLRSNGRYAKAFNYTKQPKQFIREVHKAGYATDPNYTTRIVSLMDQYDLYKYDKVTATKSPTKKPTATKSPTKKPTATKSPTKKPTATKSPTKKPTATKSPTKKPTATKSPTATTSPTKKPTATRKPTTDPTATRSPTARSTPKATTSPTGTVQPTAEPTLEPPAEPTEQPTEPTEPTEPTTPVEPPAPVDEGEVSGGDPVLEQPADPDKELPADVPAASDTQPVNTGGYPETSGGLASTGA